ncbi:MAG: AAA family ATPase, partial [Terriglobales bacterium]
AMIRLDMSEYMEKHSVARLIGAPPGYVGYEEGGQLTERVRRRPYAVVLLDEIEKAHTDVFNILLQVLDDGRLTDGQGRTVDFRNTVVIMTSNLGSQAIHAGDFADAAAEAELRRRLQEMLRAHFRPEFLNRIDDIVVFHPLGREQIEVIIDLQLEHLRHLLAEREIQLELAPSARELILAQGYDPEYGARPLKRALQRLVQNPLAQALLKGEIRPGAVIEAEAGDHGELLFHPATAAAATQPQRARHGKREAS